MQKYFTTLVLSICVLTLASCGESRREADDDDLMTKDERRDSKVGKMFGENFLTFGDDKKAKGGGIGVNQYLWQASLDVISFMPKQSADPFGGLILTEWYSSPSDPNERIKVEIRILDRQLRSDGVTVAIYKQKAKGQTWVDVDVDHQSMHEMEDAILTRARQIKINKA